MSLPTDMKQWVTSQDGIDHLALRTAALPIPGSGEVLVKVSAVSINYRDIEVINGHYNHHGSSGAPAGDLVPCSDMCGTIVSSNSYSWEPGDRVLSIFNQKHLKGQLTADIMKSGLGLPLPGVLTEYRVFPDYGLVEAPSHLSDEEAATLPIAALTAWMAINGMRPLSKPAGKGETILIQGTGGVSISGLQIAKASGAVVIITSSSDAKLDKAKRLGADKLINYRKTPHWDDEVMKLTKGEGVDIINETGGAATLRKSFNCIAFGGLINCIGYLSGKEDISTERTNINVLALKRNVTLKGLLNGSRERLLEMLDFYRMKKIRPVVDKVFGFEDAEVALRYLSRGGHFGKVVIKVS